MNSFNLNSSQILPVATTDSVRKHLALLGYFNVPDEIVQEFVDDLNSSTTLVAASNSTSTTSTKTSNKTAEKKITAKDVKKQLSSLGYNVSQISEEMVKELVEELNQSFLNGPSVMAMNNSHSILNTSLLNSISFAQTEDQTTADDRSTKPRHPISKTKPQQQQEGRKEFLNKLKELDFDVRTDDSHVSRKNEKFSHERDINYRYSLDPNIRQSNYAKRLNPTIGLSKPKRNDPVRRYHDYKKQWSNDPFLQRLENPTSSIAKRRMFGDLGYHAVMGGNQVQKKCFLAKK